MSHCGLSPRMSLTAVVHIKGKWDYKLYQVCYNLSDDDSLSLVPRLPSPDLRIGHGYERDSLVQRDTTRNSQLIDTHN